MKARLHLRRILEDADLTVRDVARASERHGGIHENTLYRMTHPDRTDETGTTMERIDVRVLEVLIPTLQDVLGRPVWLEDVFTVQ